MNSIKIDDVISLAKEKGFAVTSNNKDYNLKLIKHNIYSIEFTLPFTEIILPANAGLIYSYTIKNVNTNLVVYKGEGEEYGKEINKFEGMLKSYVKIINIFSSYDVKINDKYLFSIFGLKFWKIKVVEYFENNNWKEFNL